MKLHLDTAPAPPIQSTPHRVHLDGAGVNLVIELEADEELTDTMLALRPARTGSKPIWSAPAVDSDKDGTLADITWVSLDWHSTRTVEKVTFTLEGADNLAVRVKIAKGASQWFSPPGPTMSDVPNAGQTTRTLSFPDTTADRLLIEFVRQDLDAFMAVTLLEPPIVEFGPRARDPVVAVQAKRAIFSLAGEPSGAIEVPKLLESLREQKLALLGPAKIPLVVRAGSAGNLDLTWRFVVDHRSHRFDLPLSGPSGSIELGWAGEALIVLFQRTHASDPLARVIALEFAFSHTPKRERLLFTPPLEQLREQIGELIRPLGESAQRFDLRGPELLTGVSLWVRPLSAAVELLVALHADDGGVPAAAPLVEVPVSIAAPEHAWLGPRWLEVEFPAPVPASGRVWFVVRGTAGELSWLLGRPEPEFAPAEFGLGELRYRRNGGAWLDRRGSDPHAYAQAWALLRVRTLETGPIPPPTLELQLRTSNKHQSQTHPLPLVAGKVAWTPSMAVLPNSSTAIVLRVRSSVPTTIHASALTLRWQAVTPSYFDETIELIPTASLLAKIAGPKLH